MEGGRAAERVFAIILALACVASVCFSASIPRHTGSAEEERFFAWLEGNGARLPRVGLGDFPGMGRGIRAVKRIREGATFIRIPSKLLITEERIDASSLAAAARRHGVYLTQDQKFNAFVLLEDAKENSFFRPWFDTLPKRDPRGTTWPLFYANDELAELQKSPLVDNVRSLQKRIEDEYSHLENALFSQDRDLFPASAFTLEDYKWAASIVSSRFWIIRGQKTGVPFADMFNHKAWPANDRRTYDFADFHFVTLRDGARVVADRSTKAGEQVFETYGQQSNDVFFTYHGFVSEGNPNHCVKITDFRLGTGILDAKEKHYAKRVKILELVGVSPVAASCVYYGSIPRDMVAMARVSCMTLAELRQVKKSPELVFRDDAISAISEEQSRDLLYLYFQKKLGTYATTIEMDEDMLETGRLSARMETIVRMRLEEKRILRRAASLLQPTASSTRSTPPIPPSETTTHASEGESDESKVDVGDRDANRDDVAERPWIVGIEDRAAAWLVAAGLQDAAAASVVYYAEMTIAMGITFALGNSLLRCGRRSSGPRRRVLLPDGAARAVIRAQQERVRQDEANAAPAGSQVAAKPQRRSRRK